MKNFGARLLLLITLLFVGIILVSLSAVLQFSKDGVTMIQKLMTIPNLGSWGMLCGMLVISGAMYIWNGE